MLLKLDLVADIFSSFVGFTFPNSHSIPYFFGPALLPVFFFLFDAESVSLQIDCNCRSDIAYFHERQSFLFILYLGKLLFLPLLVGFLFLHELCLDLDELFRKYGVVAGMGVF